MINQTPRTEYFDGGRYGAIFVWSQLTNCYVTSVNPEFGMTLARRLHQSRICAVLQSNLIAILS